MEMKDFIDILIKSGYFKVEISGEYKSAILNQYENGDITIRTPEASMPVSRLFIYPDRIENEKLVIILSKIARVNISDERTENKHYKKIDIEIVPYFPGEEDLMEW